MFGLVVASTNRGDLQYRGKEFSKVRKKKGQDAFLVTKENGEEKAAYREY